MPVRPGKKPVWWMLTHIAFGYQVTNFFAASSRYGESRDSL